MSRRHLPPGGPCPRRVWPERRPFSQVAALAAAVLAREAGIGLVLWSCRSRVAWLDIGATLLCLASIVVGTRWLGVLRPHGWASAAREGALLFVGGAFCSNVLKLVFGFAPWLGGSAG